MLDLTHPGKWSESLEMDDAGLSILDEHDELPATKLEEMVTKDGISKRTYEAARGRLAAEGLIENVPPARRG